MTAFKARIDAAKLSMTYGHYSKGQRVNLRSAIEKLDYGKAVMSAL